jgi:tetratricopeptide (TPR) repeat protein
MGVLRRILNFLVSKTAFILFPIAMALAGCHISFSIFPFKRGPSRYEKRIKALKDKIRNNPLSKQVTKSRLELAKIFIKSNKLDDAFSICYSILLSNPHQVEARFYVGAIHFSRQNYRTALKNLKLIETNSSRKIDGVVVRGMIARSYEKLGNYQKAIEKYQALAGYKSCNKRCRAKVYYRIGKIYFKQKNYRKAMHAFRQGKDNYYRYRSDYFLGEIYFLKKDYINALAMYRRVLDRFKYEYSGATLNTLYRMGDILQRMNLLKMRNPHRPSRIFRLAAKWFPKIKPLLSYVADYFDHHSKNLERTYSYADSKFLFETIRVGGKIRTFVFSRGGQLLNVIPAAVKVRSKDLLVRYPNGIKVVFEGFSGTLIKNLYLLKCMHDLPAFFKGLKLIEIKNRKGRYKKADYNFRMKRIRLFLESDLETLAHELFHHWDMAITNGKKDPSRIFYKISWQMRGRCYPFICKLSISAKERDGRDFLGVGTKNHLEDIAWFGGIYYAYGTKLRKYVRNQTAKGNFEPAAKYLFIKHWTPMKGREFGHGPGLSAREVKIKLARWLKRHPGSVNAYTIKLIRSL